MHIDGQRFFYPPIKSHVIGRLNTALTIFGLNDDNNLHIGSLQFPIDISPQPLNQIIVKEYESFDLEDNMKGVVYGLNILSNSDEDTLETLLRWINTSLTTIYGEGIVDVEDINILKTYDEDEKSWSASISCVFIQKPSIVEINFAI